MELDQTTTASSPLQILMIEDSISFARLTIAQLESTFPLPHVVRHFDNITSGLASLRSQHADLIILDLNLPDSEGLETFQTVHAAVPETPIVILSSNDSDETALKAVQLGAEEYLVKGANDRLVLIRSLRFAVERKRRLEAERELDAARIIQQSLLPAENPTVDGFDIAGAMFPAVETAGDYFDFIVPLPARGDGTAGIVVADVSGHGHGPAMVMAETRGCLHAFTRTETDPARMLELTHEVLSSNQHSHFVTMFLGCLEQNSRNLLYAAAGHEAYLFPQSGSPRTLESTGLPLGFGVPGYSWASSGPHQLGVGDMLVIATDGFEEARNSDGDFFGKERLIEFLARHSTESATRVIEMLKDEVQQFAEGTYQQDDLTIVVVKVL